MHDTEVTVIGAGVVGLAIANRLALTASSVVVLERGPRPGTGTSSRNSGVIHAGLYYPPGSLMARLCVDGSALLYEFCRRHSVECRELGKLVVATDASDEPVLDTLFETATANGARDLSLIDAAQVQALEPHIRARRALFSPRTGIVDAGNYVRALARLAQDRQVQIACEADVVGVDHAASGYVVHTRGRDGSLSTHSTRLLVNAAGLNADLVAGLAGIDVDAAGYRHHFYKGEYFSLRPEKARLATRLIYPVRRPDMAGLGIHLTRDVGGRVLLGPDATPLVGRQLDFSVDESKRTAFAKAVQPFAAFVTPEDLEPEMAGIRSKLNPPGTPQRDFVVAHEQSRGLPGMVNLIGIESPGLTASLAIANHVHGLLAEDGLL